MADQVTKEIRRSILSGELKPGQQFSLREISAQLGISFIPVREALRPSPSSPWSLKIGLASCGSDYARVTKGHMRQVRSRKAIGIIAILSAAVARGQQPLLIGDAQINSAAPPTKYGASATLCIVKGGPWTAQMWNRGAMS